MGVFTQVARFFQRIESPTVTRQFQLVVQDYGKEKNLEEAIRNAMAEASTHPGVEAREVMMSGHKAFAVTDKSQGNPTTLVTVLVLPYRLVLLDDRGVLDGHRPPGELDEPGAVGLVPRVERGLGKGIDGHRAVPSAARPLPT